MVSLGLWGIIIEPHGRGVPEVVPNGRSPLASPPECGRSRHKGGLARGERPLCATEGTPCRVVLFLLHPFLCNITLNDTDNPAK